MHLQDEFLNTARKDKINLTVYLVNGVPIKGEVLGFDNFTLQLRTKDSTMLIYKHAIASIIPETEIRFVVEQ